MKNKVQDFEIKFFQKFVNKPMSVIIKDMCGLCDNYRLWLKEQQLSIYEHRFHYWLINEYGTGIFPICTQEEYMNDDIPKYSGEMLIRRVKLATEYLRYLISTKESQS